MATKLIMTSSDPAYKSFNEWFDARIAAFEESGDTASKTAYLNARTKKHTLNPPQNAVWQSDGSVILNNYVVVPEFETIFNQWRTQYQVGLTYQPI
jgi:hypothetical protein